MHRRASKRLCSPQAGSWGCETVLAIMQILDQTIARLRYSTHGRILAEMAVVRICRLDESGAACRVDRPASRRNAAAPVEIDHVPAAGTIARFGRAGKKKIG